MGTVPMTQIAQISDKKSYITQKGGIYWLFKNDLMWNLGKYTSYCISHEHKETQSTNDFLVFRFTSP